MTGRINHTRPVIAAALALIEAYDEGLSRAQLRAYVLRLNDAVITYAMPRKHGRPRVDADTETQVRAMLAEGRTQLEIRKATGIGESTIVRIRRQMQDE